MAHANGGSRKQRIAWHFSGNPEAIGSQASSLTLFFVLYVGTGSLNRQY
jgi:hypothetical protein